jgi:hypothetical protein
VGAGLKIPNRTVCTVNMWRYRRAMLNKLLPEQPDSLSSGYVVGLFTAAKAGAPMMSHRWVEVAPGLGILGDRYATSQGYWSDPRWPDQELTFIATEVADDVAIDASLLRRNVVTRGIDLDALIGVTFQLGEAIMHGVRRCDPCRYLEKFTRPGLARALHERGGLRVRILVGGRLTVGDSLVVCP